jgi:hypothetical protein
MYGMGHRYCPDCGHAVRTGHPQCSGCGTGFGELMMLDYALDNGYASRGGLGFDPLDGQFAFDLGGGLAYEPGTGDIDVETPFGDYPV